MFTWLIFDEQAANADRAASRSAIPNEYRTAASCRLQLLANPGRVILVSHRWPRQRPERNPPLTAEYVKFLAAGDRGSAVARGSVRQVWLDGLSASRYWTRVLRSLTT